MNDKPLAGTLAALIAVPVVVVCCAALTAPLLVGSIIAATTAWIGGVDPVSAVLIALIAAGAVMGIRQWRKRNAPTMEKLSKDRK